MAFWARGFRHVRAREDRPAGRWEKQQPSVRFKNTPRGGCA